MAKTLTCDKCLQSFEVPPEHLSAPALQCPFCTQVVANDAGAAPHADALGGGETPSFLANYVPPPEIAAITTPPKAAKDVAPQAPAVSGEATLSDRGAPESASVAGGGKGLMAQLAATASSDAASSIIVDGLPNKKRRLIDAGGVAIDEDELEPETDEHYQPVSNPEAEAHLQELVEAEISGEVPAQGRLFLVVLLVLLVAGYIALAFIAIRNDGLVHFGRLGQTLNIAMGKAEPMEIATAEKRRPSDVNFQPINTTKAKPHFSVALSKPLIVEVNPTTPLLVLYGQVANATGQAFGDIRMEVVMRTAAGVELAVTKPFSLLNPEYAEQLDSLDALALALSTKGSLPKVESWLDDIMRVGVHVKLPTATYRPIAVVFTRSVPVEVRNDLLFEVRVVDAEVLP